MHLFKMFCNVKVLMGGYNNNSINVELYFKIFPFFIGQCNHAVLCQQIGQEGLFREIWSLHGLLQKQRRRHVCILPWYKTPQLCVSHRYCERNISHDTQHPLSPMFCETEFMSLKWLSEEEEKAFYPGVTQSSPSKPLYLSDRGFMFSRAVM